MLCIISFLLLPHYKALVQTAYSQGYTTGQYDLKKELEENREEVRLFRQEMKEVDQKNISIHAKYEEVKTYQRKINITLDGIRMGMEDWFDVRRGEMRDWRKEQVQVLERLKTGVQWRTLEDEEPIKSERGKTKTIKGEARELLKSESEEPKTPKGEDSRGIGRAKIWSKKKGKPDTKDN